MRKKIKNKRKRPLILNIEYILFLAMAKIIDVSSLKFCYFVAKITGIIIYFLDIKHRKRTIRNILHAGMAENRSTAARLARKNFIHFGMIFAEIFKFRSIITPQNIGQHVSVSGSEKGIRYVFGDETSPSRQVIVVTAHFGNWEIAGPCFTSLSKRPMLSVMRKLDNYKIGRHLEKMREGFEHTVQDKKGALKLLLRAMKAGQNLCVVSDQHASTGEGSETVFFGHPARSHTSPGALYLRTGLPLVIVALVRKDENFNFEFIVEDVIEPPTTDDRENDIKNITQLYTSAIERMIRKYPEQWIWAHRRWLDLDRKKK